MNTAVTSKEDILKSCRKLVSEHGLSAVNMRSVAKACGVALGSLYYYFPSKNDLLIATIESVWEDIFKLKNTDMGKTSFLKYIELCFKHIQSGVGRYPNFFTIHSVSLSSGNQAKARNSMNRYFARIRKRMLEALEADGSIKKDAFTSEFTKEEFVEFVLSNVVNLLMQKKDDCKILLEIINRTVY